jgi:DNA repair protein RadC
MDADGAAPYTLIRDLPANDRPRERLRDAGADALSNAELLAILLRVGTPRESALSMATRLLSTFGGVEGLHRAAFAELCQVSGLGPAKAAQIKAALELGMRSVKSTAPERGIMRSPDDIADLVLGEMSLLDQEQVRVISLDTRLRLVASTTVYVGSVHTAHVRIGELLSEPVRVKASAMVLVHNHPSGDPTPSAADITMTQQLFEAAKLMDIDLNDHLIIGGGRFVSLRALRLGFPPAGT